ncbi:cellulase family glycosylhydrolase [Mycolicibacterium phlei]
MRWWTPPRRRWSAVLTAIMMLPMAAMLMASSGLLDEEKRRVAPVSYAVPYLLTAAINESGTTVGMADSHIWELTKPNGEPDWEAMEAHLDTMLDLGIDTVRIVIPWRGNEPLGPPGSFPGLEEQFWARSDFIVNQAAARGMAVLGVLAHAPEWGSYYPEPWVTGGLEEPPNIAAFAAYAARVAQRYGDKVSAYEIWNEPNGLTGWAPEINPALYTEVLKAAYTAIKSVDPDILVVAGVLGAVVTSPLTLDPRTFVAQMYANGAKGFFDALSFHPYHYSLPFSEGKNSIWEPWKANSPLEQVLRIRQLMIDNGDEALRIWATEYGLPTFGPNGVTEEQQKRFIQDFLEAWSQLDFAGPSFLYTLRDAYRNGALTEATSLGLFKLDPLTGEWVAKEAAIWLKAFLANPDFPTDPPNSAPGNIAEAIAAAMEAIFKSIRATVQLFQQQVEGMVNTINAMMRAVTQAIAAIFNPRSNVAATLGLPEDVQEEVAAGARMAAATVAEGSSVEGESTDEASVAVEGSAAEEGPTAGVEPAAGQDPEAEPSTDTEAEPSTDPEAEPSTDTEVSDEVTDEDVTEDATEDVTEEATEDDESREPDVRVGIVARPGKSGDDSEGADDATDSGDDRDTSDSSESSESDAA